MGVLSIILKHLWKHTSSITQNENQTWLLIWDLNDI